MKLYIKNKLISLKGNSEVKDENGSPVYNVVGKLFSITNKKMVCDLNGNKLYKIRSKFWHLFLRSAFIYDADGKKLMKVKRKFSLKSDFVIVCKDASWAVDGSFFDMQTRIAKNGKVVANLKRKVDWIDSFELECLDENDPAFLVAMVIAFDNISDKR